MDQLSINFKKLEPHAMEPEYAHETDAGLDLRAIDVYHDREYDFVEYGTGIAVEIPKGYVGLLFPRSSIRETPHFLANCVGVVDSGYKGEVIFTFRNIKDRPELEYQVGDKIGQLIVMPIPKVNLIEVSELKDTQRGNKGHGSSGR